MLQQPTRRRTSSHGSHRRPMGGTRVDLSSAIAAGRSRSALDGCARGPERRALDLAHGRAVARPAAALPVVTNLPSALSAVAAQWPTGSLAPAPRRGLARPRQDRSHRSVCRCHLRRGEKRGAAVGPTRRGKGTKIMAICDRHGLPLAVHVASASPYEPHLVPATLDARFLPELPPRLIRSSG